MGGGNGEQVTERETRNGERGTRNRGRGGGTASGERGTSTPKVCVLLL